MASSARVGASVDGGGGGGGKEPEPKRRRLLDAGGPIEDDETARQKMRDAKVYARGVDRRRGEYDGFDPDNVADVKSIYAKDVDRSDKYAITAMGYFAIDGDLPMMRWLYVNGADTRDVDLPLYFPMWLAILNLRLEVCKWLFAHGAAKDIKRGNQWNESPLSATFGRAMPSYQNVSRWLILNGALCKDDDSGELEVEIMKQDLVSKRYPRLRVEERKALLEWATDLHRPRTSFLLFLSGALSCPKHAYRTRRSSSPVRILSGKSGIMELIGDYVGFVCGREARIIRQLTELLPDLNNELDSE